MFCVTLKKIPVLIGVFCLALSSTSFGQTFVPVDPGFLIDTGYCRGISWIDVDNDNDLDVYISGTHSYDAATASFIPLNRLYVNNGDETFTQMPDPTSATASFGHGWGDYNNDGNIDLYMAKTWGFGFESELHKNNGDGTYTYDPGAGIVISSTAYEGTASWGDFDNDGYLDLYMARWNNLTNQLFHNNGDETFTAETGASVGPVVTDMGWSSTGTWGDFDNDNDLDLFVSHYVSLPATGENILYENVGGSFVPVTGAGTILTDAENTRDVNWVDYDNDRDLDIFLVNQGSSDRLYRNNGDGTFTDVSAGMGLSTGTSWTSNWGDFDNDGDKDFMTIGFSGADNRFMENLGDGTFASIDPSGILPTATSGSNSTASCFTDFNNDGWLDIHITYPNFADDYFYKNEGLSCRSWIEIELTGTSSNRDGIGARILTKANIDGTDTWQMHQVTAQNSKVAQNMQRTHFGFNDAAVIDSLIVYWPSGAVCEFANVDVNQIIDINEACVITPLLPPLAGEHDTIAFCNFDPDTLLFGAIIDGDFTHDCGDCLDDETGLFSPSTTVPGTYEIVYEKVCEADYTLTVEILEQAFAGSDSTIVACPGDPSFNLITTIPGADGGGTWYDPSGAIYSGSSFDPDSSTPGDYVYVVPGVGDCPDDSATISISVATITAAADISISDDTGCTPVTVTFNNDVLIGGGTCSWNFGDGSTASGCSVTHTYENEGCFDVTLSVTTPEGCVVSDFEEDLICVYNPPIADFSVPSTVIAPENSTVDFTNQSTDAVTYTWTFDNLGSTSEEDPQFTFPSDKQGTYTICLEARNEIGCTDETCSEITIKEDLVFYIPNAFTPDGDNFNEVFKPIFTSGFDPYDYHFTIFNRWGEMVFESYNSAYGWDGTYGEALVEDGVYIWTVDFRDKYTDRRYFRQGHTIVLQ